jgi:Nitrile hydratase, alpha chain/Nitrile hydratase beta subunit
MRSWRRPFANCSSNGGWSTLARSAAKSRFWIRVRRRSAPKWSRAWVDPSFRARLLANERAACEELDISFYDDTQLIVLENTQTVHNLTVCTLCSCYPRPVLGLPPDWYKLKPYRARAVKEPRAVLAEFGTVIPDDSEIRVSDSTALVRYLVLPKRPEGTDAFDEAQLAALVTRDAMIGVVPVSLWSSDSGDRSMTATENLLKTLPNDLGGLPADRVERIEHELDPWEKRCHALADVLDFHKIINTEEKRRGVEGLGSELISKLAYYERWIAAFANILFQKQILTPDALARKMDEVAGRYSAPPPE